jgi:hypothetical protein
MTGTTDVRNQSAEVILGNVDRAVTRLGRKKLALRLRCARPGGASGGKLLPL